MRILLTNDDGWQAEGIQTLRNALIQNTNHEVWLIAPAIERSGQSHAITLKEPIKSVPHGENQFSIYGTPADCVLVGVLGIMPEKPDLVISGINHGPNLGTDIIYSGTAGAARQSVIMGIPGLAISAESGDKGFDFSIGISFILENLDLLYSLFHLDHFININIPNCITERSKILVTHPCFRLYSDRVELFRSPRGEDYWFLKGEPIQGDEDPGSDWHAIRDGHVSVSPIHLHPENNDIEKEYRSVNFAPIRINSGGWYAGRDKPLQKG